MAADASLATSGGLGLVACTALVPMLSLGIPSSNSSAVLLSGFLMHGLMPGPMLFVKNPGWHAVFDTYAVMAETNRRKMMDRAIADKLTLAGYHYIMPGAGTFKKDGNGYVFIPVKA